MPTATTDTIGETPKKGFLRSLFAAIAPGAVAGTALMMSENPVVIASVVGILGGFIFTAADGLEQGDPENEWSEGNPAAAGVLCATASGAFAGVTAVLCVSDLSGFAFSAFSAMTGLLAFVSGGLAVNCSREDGRTSPEAVLKGTLTGAALSVALVFGGAALAPEKPVTPDHQGSAVERQLPAAPQLQLAP